jgi:drug/metabolite transporter (DMT)-like permease
MMNKSGGASDTMHGIVLLIAAVSLFGVVDGLSKILVETQSFGQIVLARYALALPVLLLATNPRKWKTLFQTKRLGLQLVRGLSPLIIGISMVFAVRYLPLAEATVILFAGPFMVVALSGRLLGERVSATSWIAVAIGFLAVLLVARPGFTELSKFAIFPFLGAVSYAVFQLMTRHLAAANEHPTTTLAWTLAVGLIAATPVALATWVTLTPTAWLLSLSLGIVFGLSQLLLVRAFSHAPANVLAPFSYVQIIAATLFGFIAFDDVPDLWTIIGIALVIAAGAYVMRGTGSR